jgi:hypothetical protein
MITYDSKKRILIPTKVINDSINAGFGTKRLGDGRKLPTIFRFLEGNKTEYGHIVIPQQIHSANVEVLEKKQTNKLIKVEDTDGVVTKDKGIVLTVITADCVPIIYADKEKGIIGISHNGWRGSLKRLVQNVIHKMVGMGAKKESIVVAIGPAIGGCCYDIDDDRYYSFLEEFESYADKIFQIRKGKRHISLAKLNYLLLLEAGIKPENIDVFPFCTKCDAKRFFSYRRNTKEKYGEMLSYIVISGS